MARRLLIYFLLDVSGSMAGEPITAVQNRIPKIAAALMKNPQFLESTYLSVITFSSSAEQLVPLTPVDEFKLPQLAVGGQSNNLGAALKLAAECAEREVVKNTPEAKGDWKPLIFIITAGVPTDDVDKGLIEFRKRRWGNVAICTAGSNADTDQLSKITEEFISLNTADSLAIDQFFDFITVSFLPSPPRTEITETSSLDQLPPLPPEIQVL